MLVVVQADIPLLVQQVHQVVLVVVGRQIPIRKVLLIRAVSNTPL